MLGTASVCVLFDLSVTNVHQHNAGVGYPEKQNSLHSSTLKNLMCSYLENITLM